MRILLLLAAVPLLAQVPYRSLQGASGKYGSSTIPNTAPWNTRTVIRFEGRLHDWTSTGRIFQWDGFIVTKSASTIDATDFYETTTPQVQSTIPAGATDIIFRIQRTAVMWSVEVWTSDGATYAGGQFVATDAANFSLGGDALDVLHNGSGGSTGVPAGFAWLRVYSTSVTRNSAMPTNVPGGDLLDYEFEGSGADLSANNITMTMTGSPTYPSTPVVPQVGMEISVRSGATFVPSCAGTNADAYKWRQQGAPPLGVSFSDATVAAPTVTWAAPFGQYTITCEATINGVKGTSTINVGTVATNAAGVVIVPDATIGLLTGSMLRNGISEWAWYDRERIRMGKYWYDDTTGYTEDFTSVEAENYYDSCLAQYQNYYRTGLTRFQTYARACADKWYSQYWLTRATAGTCGGSNWIAPRDSSFIGLVIRAYETGASSGSDMWVCLTAYANYQLDLWVETRLSPTYTALYFGPRESAYSIMGATAVAIANPNSGTRASYAARVAAVVANPVLAVQCATGFTQRSCTDVYTTGAGTIAITNGSAVGTGTGSNFTSLFAASGDTIIFQETGSPYDNFWMTVQSRASDTALTLSANYTGGTSSGRTYAKVVTTANSFLGTWRQTGEAAGGANIGWGELLWHTGLLLEAMQRIYTAGIETTNTAVIADAYGDYLIAKQATYFPTQTCTGAFANPQARRTLYSVYFAGGAQGTGCTSDADLRDQRQQNYLVTASIGFGYLIGADSALLTLGDDMWSATNGEWIGTGADGGYGDLTQITGGGVNGKFYGQSSRNASYLVSRLGASAANITPVSASFTVSALRSSVTSATKLKVTVTQSNGVSTSNTCSADTCTVSGLDSRMSTAALMRLEYLSSGDAVLARGDLQPVTIQ